MPPTISARSSGYGGGAGNTATNGSEGGSPAGTGAGGGGGGAGEIWFDAGISVVNQGVIAAMGGASAVGQCTSGPASIPGSSGAGAGGSVIIDPLSIQNFGIIDVADGNGTGLLGGLVETFGLPITGDGLILGVAERSSAVPEPISAGCLLMGAGMCF